jgi:hypothetical protein
MKHPEEASFTIGLVLALLFAIAALTIFNAVTSYLSKTYPYSFDVSVDQQITWTFILCGLDIAVPIVVGKLWKAKSSWYWLGMVIGLILYFGAMFLWGLWNAFRSIGSNPQ